MEEKKRGRLAQAWRDIRVATGMRPDSNSALAEDLEAQGFTDEDMLEMTPQKLEILKQTAVRSVHQDARQGWVEFIKQEFEVEPTAEETKVFMQMVTRKGGLVERAKKIEKVAAGLQKGYADRQKNAIAGVEEQVSGLAALLQASEARGKLLEGALAKMLDQQNKQGDALAILLETRSERKPEEPAKNPPPPVQNGDKEKKEPFAGA